jgi:hypothetical protein
MTDCDPFHSMHLGNPRTRRRNFGHRRRTKAPYVFDGLL